MELRSKSTHLHEVPAVTSGWGCQYEGKRRGRKPKPKNVDVPGNAVKLSCPTFACDFLSQLYHLYQHGVCCDVVLSTGDYQAFAHKVVLMASSEYFKSLFTTANSESDFVVLPSDFTGDAVKLLMSYMYTGVLNFHPDNVLLVLYAAERLQIKSAVDLCHEYLSHNGMKLDPSFPLLASGLELPLDQVNDVVIKEEVTNIDEAEFESKVPADLLDLRAVEKNDSFLTDFANLEVSGVTHKKRTKSRLIYKNSETSGEPKLQANAPRTKRLSKSTDITESPTNSEKAPHSRLKLRANSTRRSSNPAVCMPKPKRRRRGSYILRNNIYAVLKKATPARKVFTVGRALLATGTEYRCSKCSAGFSKYSGLKLHLKFSHEVPVSSLAVKTCRQLLKSVISQVGRRCSFARFAKPREESKTGKFTCSSCHRKFRLRACFLAHVVKYHSMEHVLPNRKESSSFRSDSMAKQAHLVRPRVYKCRLCKRPFVHQSSLASHCLVNHRRIKMDSVSEYSMPKMGRPRGTLSCKETDCGAVCTCLRELKKHMAMKHPNVIYSCPDCRFSCQVDRLFQRHRNQRHGKKQICHLCGKTCPKLSLLKQHMYIHHRIKDPSLKLYQCAFDGCTYECCSKNRLADHCSRHNLGKSLKCEECGKAFKHSLGLQKHVSTIHHGIRPFICDQCAMGFGTEGELKTHVTRHSKNKPYACSHCPYRTCAKVNLQYHLFSRHKIQTGFKEQKLVVLKCDQCGFMTSRKGRLEDHLKKHRNIRDIPCPECGKLFVTKKNLYGHTVTVHRPKTHQCTYCNYSSALLSAFKDHVRIMHTHRHEKRYECPICRFRSATSGNCRKHIQRTHKEFGVNPKYVGAPRKSDLMRAAEKEDPTVNEETEATLNLSCKGP